MSEEKVLGRNCYFWELVLHCATVILFQYLFFSIFRSPNYGGFLMLYNLLQAVSIVHLSLIQPCTQVSVLLSSFSGFL